MTSFNGRKNAVIFNKEGDALDRFFVKGLKNNISYTFLKLIGKKLETFKGLFFTVIFNANF